MSELKLRPSEALDLPEELQGELDLAGGCLGGGDQAGVAYRVAGGVEDVAFVEGWRKIRVIDYVEELGAELDVEGIGNSLDMVVFENGKIEIYQAGAD